MEGESCRALNLVVEEEIHSEAMVAVNVLVHQKRFADKQLPTLEYDLRRLLQQVQSHPPHPEEVVFSLYAQ